MIKNVMGMEIKAEFTPTMIIFRTTGKPFAQAKWSLTKNEWVKCKGEFGGRQKIAIKAAFEPFPGPRENLSDLL